MSDITINLDGIIAFIAAFSLSVIFLAGLAVVCAWNVVQARRNGGRFFRRRAFPHIVGMAACLAGYGAMLAFLWINDGPSRNHALCLWLDNRVVLWAGVILALWPAGYYAVKNLISTAAEKRENRTL